ncbi:MAG: oligosaccharide flippase family protein [Rhizomicrobium sp.]
MTLAIVANLAGRVWGALILIIFVPFYLAALGPEGYGIVGFNTTLLAIVVSLDGGVALTVNREMARLSALPGQAKEMRATLSAASAIFIALSAVVALCIWFAAPAIVADWLNIGSLPVSVAVLAIRFIGIVVAEQLIISLFQGALFGLHRQATVNAVLIAATTLRAAGALPILWYFSATPSAFFIWYAFVSLLQIAALRFLIAGNIPFTGSFEPPSSSLAKSLLRNAAGIGGIALLGLALGQIDKVLVSRVLPLAEFGYYMVAVSISQLPIMVASSIATAVFPRLSQHAMMDDGGAIRLLHASTQLIACLVIPIGLTFAFFGHEIIVAWAGNALLGTGVPLVAGILTFGNAFNGLLQTSYYFELAFGRTRPIIYMNVLALAAIIPAILVLTRAYGMAGAAVCWLALNIAYVLIGMPMILRRPLGTNLLRLYARGIAVPVAAALAVTGTARLVLPDHLGRVGGGAAAVVVCILAVLVCAALSPDLRALLNADAKGPHTGPRATLASADGSPPEPGPA